MTGANDDLLPNMFLSLSIGLFISSSFQLYQHFDLCSSPKGHLFIQLLPCPSR